MNQGTCLSIGPLHGGGFALGWGCSSRCRHCLYGSGPHRQDGLPGSETDLEELLDLFAEKAARAHWHIGGGEPFLHFDFLQKTVAGMRKRGLALDYVETNASWVKDRAFARDRLRELEEKGLSCLLVSLSPFHAEFVPNEKTRVLIEVAEGVLPGGAFVWIPEFAGDLKETDPGRVIDLEAFLKERGRDYAIGLARRYHLIPGGRAGRFLYAQGVRLSWEDASKNPPCKGRLTDTSHFHVDGNGNYVPGLCSGITIPFQRLPGEISLDEFPVLSFLVAADLRGLVETARSQGFTPQKDYSSACDLCTHIRFFLFRKCPQKYPELGPPGFYDETSISGFFS